MTGNKRLVEAVLIDHVFHGRSESQIARDKNIPEGLVIRIINLRAFKPPGICTKTITMQSSINKDVTSE